MYMLKNIKALSLLFYFIISLFTMDVILRIATSTELFSLGLVITLAFSISFAIIFFILCSLCQSKLNYMFSSIILGLSAFIFSSQLVYYKIFRTYYSLYSAGRATQVLQFWKQILSVIMKNTGWIILFFLPCLIIIVFGKRFFAFDKVKKLTRIVLICCIILSHLLSLAAVFSSGRTQHSAHNLYYESSYPFLSVNKLGLLTTMRLDLQRLFSGWSPTLKMSTSYLPIPSPHKLDGNKIVEETSEVPEDIIEEKVIEHNTMNIDFKNLLSIETDETIIEMHKYFENQIPIAKNEFTEKYKGYNLIFITAEGFSPYAVHEDATPTLYKMVHKGYHFTNFYNPLWEVSTSDGEYVACTGLLPKQGVWSFYKSGQIFLPFVMGNQLKKLDYKTLAYHNHSYTYYRRDVSHPNMGYDYKGVGNGLDVKTTWPESDLEMIEKTVPDYINSQPFHAYYMTVSGHMQYNFFGNAMAVKNKEHVKDLPYSEEGRAYIATQVELDKALQYLLEQLEDVGIADKTLIVLSADHYPYGLEYKTIDELVGHQVERNFELYKSNLIMYSDGMEPEVIDKPCSSLDIIPTLSNLLGLEYDSRLLMGSDIFSDSSPLVMFLNRSFITDKGRYNAETGEFFRREEMDVDDVYTNTISAIINMKFYYSAKILETDYYNKVLQD